LAVDTDVPTAFAVMIRIPGWLRQDPEIRVNGRRVASAAAPGTFAALRRTWKRGDRIELRLPQTFRQEPIDASHPDTVALMRGPLMYGALDFGGSGAATPGRPLARLTNAPLAPVAGASQSYMQAGTAQQTIFVPFYSVENESYDVYFQRT
jgi:DUF1680 family protein